MNSVHTDQDEHAAAAAAAAHEHMYSTSASQYENKFNDEKNCFGQHVFLAGT